jgi:DNA-binding beta-propeller fold protein YncE
LLDLAVTSDGRVFGTRWTLGEVVEIDPISGARLRVVAGDFRAVAGIVVDAPTGLLVVADYEADAVYLVDADTGRRSVRARGAPLGGPDGLAGTPDGELWVACEGNRHLVRIAADGSVSDFGAIEGGPDGIALARPEGPLAGAIIINQRDGRVTALNPNGGASVLAEGGTPGDLAAVDPRGYLHVSQLTETIRFNQPWFIPSQPPPPHRSPN